MWDVFPTEALWRAALAVIPLSVVVALVCRSLPRRPAVRHSLWLMVILWLVAAPLLPSLDYEVDLAPAPVEAVAAMEITPSPRVAVVESTKSQPVQIHTTTSATPQDNAMRHLGPDDAPETGDVPPVQVTAPPADPRPLDHRASEGNRRSARPNHDEPRASTSAALPLEALYPAPCKPVVEPTPLKSTEPAAVEPRPAAANDRLATPSTSQAPPGAWRLPKRNSPAAARKYAGKEAPAQGGPVLSTLEKTPPPAAPGVTGATPVARNAEPASTSGEVTPTRTRAWLSALVGVRDAVGQLPPIPTPVWVLGIAALGLLKLGSVLRFRRRLKLAYPAPEGTTRLVANTARQLGLKRLPVTRMLDAAVSPMVWLGRRPMLLLPRELWSQLDETGRRAVVCHELAHLRRLDHWVCWVETVIGWLYWWHPLVWWVRRQLHTEAELSCDAWVTWLMPRARTAYAQALLHTKCFVGKDRSLPPLGFGMARGRAAKFGRRLKMIMTQRSRPGQSVFGLTLVFALAVVGWVAVPAQSGPPEREEAKYRSDHNASLDERVEQLEKLVAKLTTAVERLTNVTDRQMNVLERIAQGKNEKPPKGEKRAVKVPPATAKPAKPAPPAKKLLEGLLQPPPPPERAAPQARLITRGGSDAHEVVVYSYGLSGKKLKKLGELMLRSDVPVPVSVEDDAIEVHATLPQHSVFAGFVEMIHPEAELPQEVVALSSTEEGETLEQRYQLPKEKLDDLYDLMALPDVPVVVSSSDGAITVYGTPSQQHVFKCFLELVNTGNAPAYPRAVSKPMAVYRAPGIESSSGAHRGGGEAQLLTYSLPEGKREALWNLMALKDVPIHVAHAAEGISVRGTPAEQSIFAGFVTLLQPGALLPPGVEALDSSDVGPRMERDYPLPKNKLEAMWELMSRPDVPIMVSPGKKAISVQGTASQQAVFEAFVQMIHPEKSSKETEVIDLRQAPQANAGETVARSYVLPPGKLEALTTLMVRPDVPVVVSAGANELVVHATPAQHEVFAAFVKLIGSDDEVSGGATLDFYGGANAGLSRLEEVSLKIDACRKEAALAAQKCKETQAKCSSVCASGATGKCAATCSGKTVDCSTSCAGGTDAAAKAKTEYLYKLTQEQQKHELKVKRLQQEHELEVQREQLERQRQARQENEKLQRKTEREQRKCDREVLKEKREQQRKARKTCDQPRAETDAAEPAYQRMLETGGNLLRRGIVALSANFDFRTMLEQARQSPGKTAEAACSE